MCTVVSAGTLWLIDFVGVLKVRRLLLLPSQVKQEPSAGMDVGAGSGAGCDDAAAQADAAAEAGAAAAGACALSTRRSPRAATPTVSEGPAFACLPGRGRAPPSEEALSACTYDSFTSTAAPDSNPGHSSRPAATPDP